MVSSNTLRLPEDSMGFPWKCNGISLIVLLCFKDIVWYLLRFRLSRLLAYQWEVLLEFLIRLLAVSRSSLKVFTPISTASRQTLFGITKTVSQFTSRRRTVDSAKEKLKGKFLNGMLCLRGADDSTHQLVTVPVTDSTEGKWKYVLSWLCYKRNGKLCSCVTIELWMHLGGLLSTQEAWISYPSFLLSNLPPAVRPFS